MAAINDIVARIPGGWLTVVGAVLVLFALPRLLFLLRPRRRVRHPKAWEKYDTDRSGWGQDQWDK